MEDDGTVWSINKAIQYNPTTLEVIGVPVDSPTGSITFSKAEKIVSTREQGLRSLKYFSLKSEYKKAVGHPSQKMTVDELITGILDKETV